MLVVLGQILADWRLTQNQIKEVEKQTEVSCLEKLSFVGRRFGKEFQKGKLYTTP